MGSRGDGEHEVKRLGGRRPETGGRSGQDGEDLLAGLDAQQRWYARVLGMTVEQRFELPDPPVRTVLLRTPRGLRIELIERAGSARADAFEDALDASRARGYGHWAIEVDDLDLAFAGLTRAGAELVSPPAPAVQPGARFAYVKDPEGNLVELIQPPAAG